MVLFDRYHVAVLMLCSSGCYSSIAEPAPGPFPPPPEGYLSVLQETLPGGVRVQLSAPEDAYEEAPEVYDGLFANAVEDETLLQGLGEDVIGPLGLMIELGPDGRQFTPPIYFQVSWPTPFETSPDLGELGLFTYSTERELWMPVPVDTIDMDARTAEARLEHFSVYSLEFSGADNLESVELIEPAVALESIHLRVREKNNTLGPVPYDIENHCDTGQSCGISSFNYPDFIIDFPQAGIHRICLTDDFDRCRWSQDVYVAPSPSQLDFDDWHDLAQTYRPTLLFSKYHRSPSDTGTRCHSSHEAVDDRSQHRFRPLPLDDLFSPNVRMGFKTGWTTNQMTGPQAAAYMATHARIDTTLNKQSSDDPETGLLSLANKDDSFSVYWNIADDLILILESGELAQRTFITYWMLYAWDPKPPGFTAGLGAHSMDRESLTVELSCGVGSNNCTPEAVWFNGHLKNQWMYLLDPAGSGTIAARWNGDGLRVPWSLVEKAGGNSTSPVAYVAYGSHALYPAPAIYYIDVSGENEVGTIPRGGGEEPACGNADRWGPTEDHDYSLLRLDMSHIHSFTTPNGAFLFSGAWVDGFKNGTFPPFIDRFHSPNSWANDLLARNKGSSWCPNGECLAGVFDGIECVSGQFDIAGAGNGLLGTALTIEAPEGLLRYSLFLDDEKIAEESFSLDLPKEETAGFWIEHDASNLTGIHTLALWVKDRNNCTENMPVATTQVDFGDGTGPETCNDGIQNQEETGVDCGGPCAPCQSEPDCSVGERRRCWVECVQTYADGCIHAGVPPLIMGIETCGVTGWGQCEIQSACADMVDSCMVGDFQVAQYECEDGSTRTGQYNCLLPPGAACTTRYYGNWPPTDCPEDLCQEPCTHGEVRPCEVYCDEPGGVTRPGTQTCVGYCGGYTAWGPCQTNDGCLQ